MAKHFVFVVLIGGLTTLVACSGNRGDGSLDTETDTDTDTDIGTDAETDTDSDTDSGIDTEIFEETCELDLGITEEDAVQPDLQGEDMSWTADFSEDQLRLRREGGCGAEGSLCVYYELLVFADIYEDCPELISAKTAWWDDITYAYGSFEASSGEALIQDWNLEGIVSGQVTTDDEYFAPLFYFDLSAS